MVENGSFSWYAHRFADAPSHTFLEFMGGGCPVDFYGCKWVDRQTWDHLKTQLTESPAVGIQSIQSPANNNFLIVQGRVATDGTARLGNCYTLSGSNLMSDSLGGTYTIETLDQNSIVLSTLSFEPLFRPYDSDVEMDQAPFSFALPFSNAARQLRLRAANDVLASRTISTRAPSVNFLSDFSGQTLTGPKTVSWSGSDADGDTLSYSLYYSPDGQLQIPLVLETSGTNYVWNTDTSPSGPSSLLTLVATDGVHATAIDSPRFVLPNRPPQIIVLSPLDQAQFKDGETVRLEGTFDDPEDGSPTNPALEWSSDLQGPLGTGAGLVLTNLAIGTNIITAAASDSQGQRGTASIRVIVRTNSVPRVHVSETELGLGTLPVGETRELSLMVRNSGNAPLLLNSITSTDNQFIPVQPSAPFTILPREQQLLTVRFAPHAVGEQSAVLLIESLDPEQPTTAVFLTGFGEIALLLKATIVQNQLILSWPASATGFSLQSATSLTPPINWQPVTTSVNSVGDQNTVTLSPADVSRFYRLAR